MLRLALLIAILAVSAALGWLIWENRGSEKLLTATFAVVAAAVAVFMFTKPASFSETFGTTLLLDTATQLPILPPADKMLFSTSIMSVIDGATSKDKRWTPDDGNIMRLYHHVLQRAVFNSLVTRYNSDWRIAVARVETGIMTVESWGAHPEGAPTGTRIPESEVKRLLSRNRFVDTQPPFPNLQLVVPPDMRMTVRAPGEDSNSEDASISFENRYYKLTITTAAMSAGKRIGRYAVLFGIPDNDDRFSSVTFSVRVAGKAKAPFQMHPDIPKFEEWGKQIAETLRGGFDDVLRWKTAADNATFRQMFPRNAQ